MSVRVSNFEISNDLPFVLIAGPCALEGRDFGMKMAEIICGISEKVGRPFIFKSSFDKANRTSVNSGRGVQFSEAINIFHEIRTTFKCPIVTDVHETYQCNELADVVDVLQIPAFLCRQTDLLLAAARTGKVINVKKGQFLAPWDMRHVCKKIESVGNHNILLCERGTCFGYNRLITDLRSLPIMSETGYPVIFDGTHSVQEPGGLDDRTGGAREYIEVLSRGALSVGCAGLFIETHYDPDYAISDGPNMLPVQKLYDFWMRMIEFDELSKKKPYIDVRYDHSEI